MKVPETGIDFEVDEDLLVRITNIAPEDDVTMTALALGNLITSVMRLLAAEEDDDDEPQDEGFA